MIRILARPVCVEVSCDQNEIGSATTTTAITEAEILPGGVGRLAALWRGRPCEWPWFSWAGKPIVVVILGPAARHAVHAVRSSQVKSSSRQVTAQVRHWPVSSLQVKAAWLTRPLNALGQGQGQKTNNELLARTSLACLTTIP